MLEIKQIMKQERANQDKKINDILEKYNVKFEGTGPEAYKHSNEFSELEDEEYDPYN